MHSRRSVNIKKSRTQAEIHKYLITDIAFSGLDFNSILFLTMNTFAYPPLDRSTNSIRLLEFLFGQPEDNGIYCVLKTHDIATIPEFVALSYTWGEPQPSYDIILNEVRFPVGGNLWHALHELQRASRNKKLGDSKQTMHLTNHFWIDAICINQADFLERGHQVNLMKDIYSRAQCVVAYLGLVEDNSDLAMETISRAIVFKDTALANDHFSMIMQWCVRSHSQTTLTKRQSSGVSKHMERARKKAKLTDHQRSAISQLFERPYWERAWVIQEFLLAEDVWILCGSRGTWWLDFYGFLTLLGRHSTLVPVAVERIFKYRSERYTFTESLTATSAPLSILLPSFYYTKCKDPRDRIYSLLGLIGYGNLPSSALRADYTISATRLYYRVLGFLRDSNPRRFGSQWINLSGFLSTALEVDSEDIQLIYRLHNVVYAQYMTVERLSELSRPASVIPILEQHFSEHIHMNVEDPQGVYDRVVGKIRESPMHEYKKMYQLLQGRVKEALGLTLTTESMEH